MGWFHERGASKNIDMFPIILQKMNDLVVWIFISGIRTHHNQLRGGGGGEYF